MYKFRPYNHETDREAVQRIWLEIQWIEKGDEPALDAFLKDGRSLVAELAESAECLVTSKMGTLKYLKQDLDLSIVTSVTTSRIVRKQGLAKKLTAQLIAEDAQAGALVSTLGIFEQGFYEQLGYGAGGYEHWISFDPADLTIDQKIRPPKRLTIEDSKIMYHAQINRHRRHGAVSIHTPNYLSAELLWSKNGYGLGYTDGPEGELTHYFWASSKGEHGPVTIHAMAFQTTAQFLELMALIKSLGDAIRLVKMREPAGMQIQDLIKLPFRSRIVTSKSDYEHINRASAYWQTRICNLEACIKATTLNSRPVSFNLRLSDPIEKLLNSDFEWKGCAGEYSLILGPDSEISGGFKPDLPILDTDIGTFTRLWMGVRPASGLAITGKISAPDELLEVLDEVLCLPDPRPDWDY